jgi:hypothetical protein
MIPRPTQEAKVQSHEDQCGRRSSDRQRYAGGLGISGTTPSVGTVSPTELKRPGRSRERNVQRLDERRCWRSNRRAKLERERSEVVARRLNPRIANAASGPCRQKEGGKTVVPRETKVRPSRRSWGAGCGTRAPDDPTHSDLQANQLASRDDAARLQQRRKRQGKQLW